MCSIVEAIHANDSYQECHAKRQRCFCLDIRRENNILFNLTTNVIYGIRQNYLIRSCLEGTPESAFYDRHYQSFRTNENNPNRYTIFYSTGMFVLISLEFMTDMLEHALFVVFFLHENFDADFRRSSVIN